MRKLRVIVTAIICFWGIPLFFIFSSGLADLLTEKLNLHVLPSYTGGVVIGDFTDDTGDELLPYPDHAAFTAGSLDLVRYTVHQPVYGAKWQKHAEYWQLDLEYGSGPALVRDIKIHIDADAVQLLVWIQNGSGTVYDGNGKFLCNTEYYELNDGRTIRIRIPLAQKELQPLYTAKTMRHSVETGNYAPFGTPDLFDILGNGPVEVIQ